jgi:hypothetical protein
MARTTRREILQPASAFAVLSADWLVWLIGDYFDLGLLSAAVLWGAAFAGVCVWLIEGLATHPVRAFAKALLAALIVWAPGLVAGTVIGLLALAWWLSVRMAERHHRQRR